MARENRKRRARPVYPVPELVTGEEFDIREGTGSVEMGVSDRRRVIRVPLDDTGAARHVRAHETAHARYSPSDPRMPASIPNMAIQRAEDMRMNYYCRKHGLDEAMDAPLLEDEEMQYQLVTRPLAFRDKLAAVSAACSAYQTGDWPLVIAAIRATDPTLADSVEPFIPTLWDSLDTGEPTWDDAISVARKVVEFCNTPPDERDGEPDSESESGGKSDSDSDSSDESPESGDSSDSESSEPSDPTDSEPSEGTREVDLSSDPMDKTIDSQFEKMAEEDKQRTGDPVEDSVRDMLDIMDEVFGHERGNAKVMPVKIAKRPLTQRLGASKLKGRHKIAADTGRVPRYMGRYCSDRTIFEGTGKRKGGGAILIDCSGSMHLSNSDIDRILDECPAGIIATYAGDRRADGGELGELWIIAANGKRASSTEALSPNGYGNMVDYPSLQWLAKQRGDKYWINDGYVSGSGDVHRMNIAHLCAQVCRKARIARYTSVDALIDALKGGG